MKRRNLQQTTTWIVVAVILAGALAVAAGICFGTNPPIIVGAAAIVAGLVAAVVLPKLQLGIPISFAEDYPSHTAEAEKTEGREPDPSRYHMLPEVPSAQLPDTPDPEGAIPQHVNLGPHERIRRIHGRDVIELPEEESAGPENAG